MSNLAAIYLRVSTTEQEPQNQAASCERICEARGWKGTQFIETESGAKKRPVWAQVMEHARRGEVKAVVVWSIDRIGRVRTQIAHDLAELLRFGVPCVSVQQPWLDSAPGPLRELLVQVMGWVAEGERIELIARTKAGLARARAEGKVLGRPRTPPETVTKVLRLARQEPLPGHPRPTPGQIARTLGMPAQTVRDILTKNPPQGKASKPTEGRAGT
jgi:DNA invertase Pin-like site-specific DNA recombinase